MNNKSKGNKFEENVAYKLAEKGFWATLLAGANHTGSQPADIIATKNNKFWIIDCKTLENKTGRFTIDRAENNQIAAYKKLYKVGSYNYFYYIIWQNDVYSVPMEDIIHADKSINVKNYPRIWRDFYEN